MRVHRQLSECAAQPRLVCRDRLDAPYPLCCALRYHLYCVRSPMTSLDFCTCTTLTAPLIGGAPCFHPLSFRVKFIALCAISGLAHLHTGHQPPNMSCQSHLVSMAPLNRGIFPLRLHPCRTCRRYSALEPQGGAAGQHVGQRELLPSIEGLHYRHPILGRGHLSCGRVLRSVIEVRRGGWRPGAG